MLVWIILLFVTNEINCDPRVVTKKGVIQGLHYLTPLGNEANLFLGIPYAEPPEYELRYKPPVPRQPWAGVMNCTYYKDACPQTAMNTAIITNYTFSEDCLTVNVFAGIDCTESSPCPVWNYIFGGANIFDGPAMFPWYKLVDNFASKGLVVVTTNYRVDSYGFFSTETNAALGNWALYDQIQGLKWIQEEISAFGGDPKKVTVQGHSSGAQCISLITLSPKVEEGLFHQAVPMSGVAYSSAGLNSQVNHSKTFAIEAGCATESQWNAKEFANILTCLRSKSFLQLNEAQRRGAAKGSGFNGPCIDGPDGLIPTNVAELSKTRRPYRSLLGFTSAEQDMVFEGLATLGKLPQQFVDAVCASELTAFGFKNIMPLSHACSALYESTGLPVENQLGKLVDDALMWMPGLQDTRSMLKAGATVYLYSFEKPKLTGILASLTTPYHAMDLAYVFGLYGFLFDDPDPTDRVMEQLYPQVFASFAKYGNPTPAGKVGPEFEIWQPVATNGSNYYKINLPKFVNGKAFHRKSDKLWFETFPMLDAKLGSTPVNNNTFAKETNKLLHTFKQFQAQKPSPFNVYLFKFYQSDLMNLKEGEPPAKSNFLTVFFIGLGLLAVVTVIGFFVFRKKKVIAKYEYDQLD